jgi:hypothetical protein
MNLASELFEQAADRREAGWRLGRAQPVVGVDAKVDALASFGSELMIHPFPSWPWRTASTTAARYGWTIHVVGTAPRPWPAGWLRVAKGAAID